VVAPKSSILYYFKEDTTSKITKKALTCKWGHDTSYEGSRDSSRTCKICKRSHDKGYDSSPEGKHRHFKYKLRAKIRRTEAMIEYYERIVREQEIRYRNESAGSN
jgi:hypothetical protein